MPMIAIIASYSEEDGNSASGRLRSLKRDSCESMKVHTDSSRFVGVTAETATS